MTHQMEDTNYGCMKRHCLFRELQPVMYFWSTCTCRGITKIEAGELGKGQSINTLHALIRGPGLILGDGLS